MASGDGKGLVVAMYAPVLVQYQLPSGNQVTLNMDTKYPFNDTVELTVQSSEEMTLSLRIPSWAKGATVQVNTTSKQTVNPGT